MHKEASRSLLIFRPGVWGLLYSGDGDGDFLEERRSEAWPLCVVPCFSPLQLVEGSGMKFEGQFTGHVAGASAPLPKE